MIMALIIPLKKIYRFVLLSIFYTSTFYNLTVYASENSSEEAEEPLHKKRKLNKSSDSNEEKIHIISYDVPPHPISNTESLDYSPIFSPIIVTPSAPQIGTTLENFNDIEEITDEQQTEKFFKESRVRTSKLAYFYKDKYFDFTEWERQSAILLLNITNAIHKTPQLNTMNLALAQLSVICEENTEIYKVDYMLPYFFMSRWPDQREEDAITQAFSAAKKEVIDEGTDAYNYAPFHVGNGNEFTWKDFYPQFKQHLKNIFSISKDSESSLALERITQREKQINTFQMKDFSRWYFHSEQAILIYLMHKIDEFFPIIFAKINKEATITTLLLNIVSFNDMCERCGDTFFRATERSSFVSIMKATLKENNYKIPLEEILFFVACSGLEKYPSDDHTILRDQHDHTLCSISHENKDGIDVFKYKYPTVAQHYLTEEGFKS